MVGGRVTSQLFCYYELSHVKYIFQFHIHINGTSGFPKRSLFRLPTIHPMPVLKQRIETQKIFGLPQCAFPGFSASTDSPFSPSWQRPPSSRSSASSSSSGQDDICDQAANRRSTVAFQGPKSASSVSRFTYPPSPRIPSPSPLLSYPVSPPPPSQQVYAGRIVVSRSFVTIIKIHPSPGAHVCALCSVLCCWPNDQ